MNLLSTCLITRNEEHNLSRVLNSVRGVADEVVVVDCGSTDRTLEIARDHGATRLAACMEKARAGVCGVRICTARVVSRRVGSSHELAPGFSAAPLSARRRAIFRDHPRRIAFPAKARPPQRRLASLHSAHR